MKVYKQREVVAMIRAKQGDRTQEQFAAYLGVSFSFLAKVYGFRRKPSGKMLEVFSPPLVQRKETKTVWVEVE